MARYMIRATDSTGKLVDIQTPDYGSDQERDAEFARLQGPADQGGGFQLHSMKPLDAAASPPPAGIPRTPEYGNTQQSTTTTPPESPPATTPTSSPPSAVPGANFAPPGPTSLQGNVIPPTASNADVAAQRQSALGTAANIGLSTLAMTNPAVRAGEIALGRAANPLIRTLGPPALRAGASAVGGAVGGAADAAIQGQGLQAAGANALDQAWKSAVGSGISDAIFSPLTAAGSFLKSKLGVTLTEGQQAGIQLAMKQAEQENRPFSLVGYVMSAPEFAGTPEREKIWRLAQFGSKGLQEGAGVKQVRYSQDQANQALTAAGGPMLPEAQGVAGGFGADARPVINDALGRLQQEARTTAQGTVKKVSPAIGPSVRKEVQSVLGNLSLSPEDAAARMSIAQRLPQERALARESATRQYNADLGDASAAALQSKLVDIKDKTGIDLSKVTQESLATQLSGTNADRVAAITKDVPELAPLVARAKLTDAIDKAGANIASDSFNPRIFVKEVRSLGEHNFDAVFGSNADPMRKLLDVMDTYVEGAALAKQRATGLTEKKPVWQQIALVLGPVGRIIAGGFAGAGLGATIPAAFGLGSALGGAGGLVFGTTTAAMTGAPDFYARMLTNPKTLKLFTSLVDEAGHSTLGPQTITRYVAQFVRNLTGQTIARRKDLGSADSGPSAGLQRLSTSMSPPSGQY